MDAVQDTVEVPDPITLVGLITAHTRPDGTVSVRLIVPLKWLRAVMLIVAVACWPVSVAAGEVAAMVKSLNVNVAVVEWMSDPLVAVIVRV